MINRLQSLYTLSKRYLLAHKISSALILGLALGLLFGISIFIGNQEVPPSTDNAGPTVTLASIGALSNGNALVFAVGTVRSTSEATIRTQGSGQLTSLNYKLGDFVPASAVIASIENQSERAVVASARANLMRVEASVARENASTQADAWTTYQATYLDAYDAITNQTETFFEDDRTGVPKLLVPSYGDTTIVKDRVEITKRLTAWQKNTVVVPAPDTLVSYLVTAENDLAFMSTFLTKLGAIVNKQKTGSDFSADELEAQRDLVVGAQSSIQSARGAIISAKDTWGSNVVTGAGASGEAQAQLASAQASLASALAALEKTIIRAPISGSLSALDLHLGDFVGNGIPVVTITNPGTFEIITYVTEKDAPYLSVGTPVLVNDTISAKVTSIAPGVNPETKKVEVRIGITDENAALASGSTVSLTVESNTAPLETPEAGLVTIPLTALKLTTEGAHIFSVNQDHALEAHNVTIERILGDQVTIVENLPSEMQIVVDARGLKEGQKVMVEAK